MSKRGNDGTNEQKDKKQRLEQSGSLSNDSDVQMTDAKTQTRGWIDFTSDAEKAFYPDMKIQSADGKTLHYYRNYIMQSDAVVLKTSLTAETDKTTELTLAYSANTINIFLNCISPTCNVKERPSAIIWLEVCDAIRMAHQYESKKAKAQIENMLRLAVWYPWNLGELEKAYNDCKIPLQDLATLWVSRRYSAVFDHLPAAHSFASPSQQFWEVCINIAGEIRFKIKYILPYVKLTNECLKTMVECCKKTQYKAEIMSVVISTAMARKPENGLAQLLTEILTDWSRIATASPANSSSSSSSGSSSALPRRDI